MSEAAKKPRTKQTGPRVFIVTIGGEQFHITANDFRVASVSDNVGLLSGEIKPLRRVPGSLADSLLRGE